MKQYKYEVFISYRHIEPDMTIAKRLHTMLEMYAIPKKCRKGGRKYIGRVFRDNEELPASEDLTKNIMDALENSHFLLVVCSRNTPLSKWCEREIREFKRLHGSAGILALLIDGEPAASFPAELCRRNAGKIEGDGNIGTEQEKIDPLAADIRDKNIRRSLKRLRDKELFRLLAPILGVSFDELWQRGKRRKQRAMIRWGSAAAILCLLIGAIAVVDSRRLEREALAGELSQELSRGEWILEEGGRTDALRIAVDVLDNYPKQQKDYGEKRNNALALLYECAYAAPGSLLGSIKTGQAAIPSELGRILDQAAREAELEEETGMGTDPDSGNVSGAEDRPDAAAEWMASELEAQGFSLLDSVKTTAGENVLVFVGHSADSSDVFVWLADLEGEQVQQFKVPCEAAFYPEEIYVAEDFGKVLVEIGRGVYETRYYVYDMDRPDQAAWNFSIEGQCRLEAVTEDGSSFVASVTPSTTASERNAYVLGCNAVHRTRERIWEGEFIADIAVLHDWSACIVMDYSGKASIINLVPYYIGGKQEDPVQTWRAERKSFIDETSYYAEGTTAVRISDKEIRIQDAGSNQISTYCSEEEIGAFCLYVKKNWLVLCKAPKWEVPKQGYFYKQAFVVWDYKNERVVKSFDVDVSCRYTDICLALDGKTLYMGGEENWIDVLDLETETMINTWIIEKTDDLPKAVRTRYLLDFDNDRMYIFECEPYGAAFSLMIQPTCTIYCLSTMQKLLTCKNFAQIDPDELVSENTLRFSLVPEYGVVITAQEDERIVGTIPLEPESAVLNAARAYLEG